MAERRPPVGPRSRARPPRPSLREQVRALKAVAPSDRSTAAPDPPTTTQAKPKIEPLPPQQQSEPAFRDLALGVQPLPRAVPRVTGVPPTPAAAPSLPARASTRLWVEQTEGEVRARAEGVPARWLDELAAGRVVPRRQLDLHRKSAAEARLALGQAVREARRAVVRCLLVVCGQGKHSSAEGPVLPEVAVDCLSEALADEILAFTSAPRKWGGLGALLVRLRPRRR
jgi:DNA-nicking Smr family endonuclease